MPFPTRAFRVYNIVVEFDDLVELSHKTKQTDSPYKALPGQSQAGNMIQILAAYFPILIS